MTRIRTRITELERKAQSGRFDKPSGLTAQDHEELQCLESILSAEDLTTLLVYTVHARDGNDPTIRNDKEYLALCHYLEALAECASDQSVRNRANQDLRQLIASYEQRQVDAPPVTAT